MALRNLGDLKFEDVGAAWGLNRVGVSFGAATADFDNDGDLDLVVNNADVPLSIYRNSRDTGHRVRIRLHGSSEQPIWNWCQESTWLPPACDRQVTSRSPVAGYRRSSRSRRSASATRQKSTSSRSPGRADISRSLPTCRRPVLHDHRTVRQPRQRAPATPPGRRQCARPRPQFVADRRFRKIEHRETPFDDFAQQPLLPHKLSEPGPAMAWADVDGDKLD